MLELFAVSGIDSFILDPKKTMDGPYCEQFLNFIKFWSADWNIKSFNLFVLFLPVGGILDFSFGKFSGFRAEI